MNDLAKTAYENLKEQFHLPELSRNELVDYNLLLERIKEGISSRLQVLLQKNHRKVFEILYKVDVPENLIDESFNQGDSKACADMMADLIIKRQLKKIETQRNYKLTDDF